VTWGYAIGGDDSHQLVWLLSSAWSHTSRSQPSHVHYLSVCIILFISWTK